MEDQPEDWIASKVVDGSRIIEIGFSFIPLRWLAQKASYLTGAWGSSSHRSLWNFNLQYRPVVDFDSEIFEACERGDISCMKSLFDRRRASPYDVNPSGETLLLVSIQPALNIHPTLKNAIVDFKSLTG
jgi:hypothetical protein